MIITDAKVKTATNSVDEMVWDDFSSFHYVTSTQYIVEAHVTLDRIEMIKDKGILKYSPQYVMSMEICGIIFSVDPTKSYVLDDCFSTTYFISAEFSNSTDAYDVLNKLKTYECNDKHNDDIKDKIQVTNALDFIEL